MMETRQILPISELDGFDKVLKTWTLTR
jgi:hypothetical protein